MLAVLRASGSDPGAWAGAGWIRQASYIKARTDLSLLWSVSLLAPRGSAGLGKRPVVTRGSQLHTDFQILFAQGRSDPGVPVVTWIFLVTDHLSHAWLVSSRCLRVGNSGGVHGNGGCAFCIPRSIAARQFTRFFREVKPSGDYYLDCQRRSGPFLTAVFGGREILTRVVVHVG